MGGCQNKGNQMACLRGTRGEVCQDLLNGIQEVASSILVSSTTERTLSPLETRISGISHGALGLLSCSTNSAA